MKKYAVFAKKVKNEKHEEFVVWHFLNDTNDINEAFLWYLSAKNQTEKYDGVQIVQSIEVGVTLL